MHKKLLKWMVVNHSDKCSRPDATERCAAMNERFAKLKEAVEKERTRQETEPLARNMARRQREREAAAAAEASAPLCGSLSHGGPVRPLALGTLHS